MLSLSSNKKTNTTTNNNSTRDIRFKVSSTSVYLNERFRVSFNTESRELKLGMFIIDLNKEKSIIHHHYLKMYPSADEPNTFIGNSLRFQEALSCYFTNDLEKDQIIFNTLTGILQISCDTVIFGEGPNETYVVTLTPSPEDGNIFMGSVKWSSPSPSSPSPSSPSQAPPSQAPPSQAPPSQAPPSQAPPSQTPSLPAPPSNAIEIYTEVRKEEEEKEETSTLLPLGTGDNFKISFDKTTKKLKLSLFTLALRKDNTYAFQLVNQENNNNCDNGDHFIGNVLNVKKLSMKESGIVGCSKGIVLLNVGTGIMYIYVTQDFGPDRRYIYIFDMIPVTMGGINLFVGNSNFFDRKDDEVNFVHYIDQDILPMGTGNTFKVSFNSKTHKLDLYLRYTSLKQGNSYRLQMYPTNWDGHEFTGNVLSFEKNHSVFVPPVVHLNEEEREIVTKNNQLVCFNAVTCVLNINISIWELEHKNDDMHYQFAMKPMEEDENLYIGSSFKYVNEDGILQSYTRCCCD